MLMRCHMPTVLGLCRPDEDSEFKDSLDYITRSCLKMTENKNKMPHQQEPKTQPMKNDQLSKFVDYLLRATQTTRPHAAFKSKNRKQGHLSLADF